jgi:hypothetical protein
MNDFCSIKYNSRKFAILGAASNIIIIQTAESKGIRPLPLWNF